MIVCCGGAACSIFTDLSGYAGGGDAGAPEGGDATAETGGDATPSGDGGADAAVVSYRAAVLADRPLAYLRFGESSGAIASDETGNGNTAAVSGTVAWGVPGALAGDKDTAVRLDGKTSVIDLGGKIDFSGTSPFSLEIWLDVATADSSYRFLVVKDDRPASGREEWGVVLHNVDGLYFERYVAGGGRSAGTPAAPYLGRWVYTVATYDGSRLNFFVEGVSVDSGPDPRPQLAKNVPLQVGSGFPNGGVIDGSIDELAIYDHALSPERIKAHFDAARPK